MIGDSSGVATATMMVATTRLGLNLNHAPPPAYEDPAREGLKQAMIQHEIVFKNQVRELHRLYWTQKNLMNEVYWGRSDRVSVHRGSDGGEEEKAGDVGSPLPRMRMRDFDLQLPAEEFIDDAADEFADEFVQGNSSSSTGCAFGAGHMNLDLNTIQNGADSSSLVDISANMRHSRVTALSDLYSVSRIAHEGGYSSREGYSHRKHQSERWQENLIHSKVGLKEHGASLSANSSYPYEELRTKPKLMHIDLNIAQDDETVDISSDNAEAHHSTSTSSSVVLDGDNLRVPVTVHRNAAETTFVQPGAVSKQSSDVIADGWNYRDGEVCRSRCHTSSMQRLSGDYNRETHGSTNGAVLDLHKPGKETAETLSVYRDGRKNVSDSSNCIQPDSLHASASSTNQPRNLAVGLEEQPMHTERSEEEDTVSSHAINPDEQQQQDELKESAAAGIELNRLSEDGECTSKEKRSSEEHAVISNSENSGTTHAGSASPQQHKEQNVEQDNFIVKAAETLVSIFSENLSRSPDRSKLSRGECNDHPHISDSFEAQTLTLQEEAGDDATSAAVGRTANETREEVRRVQLRRGRRLRDFQKDVLPGMVSLSRQEICEDLYAIKYELRKKRSRRTGSKNGPGPVRSRRSKLGVGRRR